MTLKLELTPKKAAAVRCEKAVVAAVWFGPGVLRPYIHPFLGPGGCELTRLGHPHDPVSHSHHRGIWMGHHDLSGQNFWEESPGAGRIEAADVQVAAAEGAEVSLVLQLSWRGGDGKEVLLERRRLSFHDLPGEELALEIDSELRPAGKEKPVFGVSPFGLLGIRLAATLAPAEGLGGLISNSQEAENEAGCMGQHAGWCDGSGPVPAAPAKDPAPAGTLAAALLGLACFSHPANVPPEALWHVRDDGWFGPSLSRAEPRPVPEEGLRLRYRIEAHAGRPGEAGIEERYRRWRKAAAG